jgi:hypothetical protein
MNGEAAATTASAPEMFISLKKNQALILLVRVFNREHDKYNLQVLNDPLHNTKIVHHLYKCNKKDYGGELETN